MIRTLLVLLFLSAFCTVSRAQSNLLPGIDHLINHSSLQGSIVGIAVKNHKGEQVYNHNEDLLMIPASTLKIITTFASLDLLGQDFTYKTNVYYDGYIDRSGTLNGNIIVIGAGDPSLGSPRENFGRDFTSILVDILTVLKNKGVQCIDGKIIVNNDRFDEIMAHPNWPYSDVGNYYGGGVSGININENQYTIHFNTNKKLGSKADLIDINPFVPFLTIKTEVTIEKSGSGDNAYIYGGPGNYEKVIRGTLPQGAQNFEIKGSLPDPAEFFAYHLSTYLDRAGISNSGYEINVPETGNTKKILVEFRSQNLKDLVKLANEKSINLYCEAFLKTISKAGTREEGIQTINSILSNSKLDTFSILMEDGSGLSPRNSVTPEFFVSFLDHYKNKWGIQACINLLPQASKNGTIRGLLKNSPASGSAYLKSGFFNKVLCYAGYVHAKSGNWLSVALMFNQYRCDTSEARFIVEKILEEIYLSS